MYNSSYEIKNSIFAWIFTNSFVWERVLSDGANRYQPFKE